VIASSNKRLEHMVTEKEICEITIAQTKTLLCYYLKKLYYTKSNKGRTMSELVMCDSFPNAFA
jgi:hypothetical protein